MTSPTEFRGSAEVPMITRRRVLGFLGSATVIGVFGIAFLRACEPDPANETPDCMYTVQPGESAWSLSNGRQVIEDAIVEVNNGQAQLMAGAVLTFGETICKAIQDSGRTVDTLPPEAPRL